MVDKIEMSLDDIIKSNKRSAPNRGRGGARRGVGGRKPVAGSPRKNVGADKVRRGVIKGRRGAGGIQKAKFSRGDVNKDWQHDMYDGPKRSGLKKAIGNELAKLVVSNLEFGVSDADIRELFAEFGPLKKAAVHYDRSGRSLGSADVVFERRADAIKAMKQYNGVPLDGRAMKIQFATSDVATISRIGGVSAAPSVGPARRRLGNSAPSARRGGGAGRRGGAAPSRRGGAGGGRRGGGRVPSKSAEELDAELDAYVNDMKS